MNALKELRIATHRHLIRWGIDTRKLRPDRAVLEKIVFPELIGAPEYRRILFVGCAWYTLHYPKLFAKHDFHTIEVEPDEAKYGAAKHIVDSCENIDKYFEPSSLDVVVFNGVYGCGLNEMGPINRTLNAICSSLRIGGLFVFGWNDLPHMAPYRIDEIEGLRRFEPYRFPPLNTTIYESDSKNRHRFHFYVRPQLESATK